MRALLRPRIELPTLAGGPGARTAAKHLAARGEDAAASLDFPDHWNRADVRGALYAMHGRVCAFCLSELTRGDRGDVEHFRPKSLYFWLAYSFENYLLSCLRCNRTFKGDHFPLAPEARRIDHSTRVDLADEQRLFLDPVADPVEDWVCLVPGDLLLWKAAPTLSPDSVEHRRVTTTSHRFHWNDDPDLVIARTEAIDRALFAYEKGDRDEARRLASRFLPHGGAVRSLFAWLGVSDLPTVSEEVTWLLEDFFEEWQWAERIGGELCEKRIEELRWAFAVLWKAPPHGANIDVGAWLSEVGLLSRIEPAFRQL